MEDTLSFLREANRLDFLLLNFLDYHPSQLPLRWTTITYLRLSNGTAHSVLSAQEFLQVLSRAPNLVVCWTDIDSRASRCLQRKPHVTLPHLQRLTICNQENELDVLFDNLTLPSLNYIYIHQYDGWDMEDRTKPWPFIELLGLFKRSSPPLEIFAVHGCPVEPQTAVCWLKACPGLACLKITGAHLTDALLDLLTVADDAALPIAGANLKVVAFGCFESQGAALNKIMSFVETRQRASSADRVAPIERANFQITQDNDLTFEQ